LIGGGTSLGNAATTIEFYTAANNTTTTGTSRWRIDSDGHFLVNSNDAKDIASTGNKIRTGYFGTSVFTPKVFYSATVFDSVGTGTPLGNVTAGVGSTYRRTDGGAGTSFYVKESGTDTTGWVAK
jgi:hypothetical protein